MRDDANVVRASRFFCLDGQGGNKKAETIEKKGKNGTRETTECSWFNENRKRYHAEEEGDLE